MPTVIRLNPRDKHKLAIIKREARGHTSSVESSKKYRRHPKHRGRVEYE